MEPLKLHFLGPPRIEKDGVSIEPDTRKATALLAYVALCGEPQTRDALAALLWPELDETRGKAALRRTLSALKAAVGPAALLISREAIGLQPGQVWCDVLQFQQLAAQDNDRAALQTAVDLYRADFLSGFFLRDSIPFDDWQVWQATMQRQTLERALLVLIETAIAAGAIAEALPLAQRLLSVDPLREEVQRTLMRLYAWLGRPNAALRQYRECVRILDEELGVPPLAETTALYEALLDARLAGPEHATDAALAPTPSATPTVLPPLPLVGRAAALVQMQQAYSRVGPQMQLLAVTGETGIGKTRLAEQFLTGQRANGSSILAARCYAGESNLAYAPLIQLLREGAAQPGARERLAGLPASALAEAARLLPEIADLAAQPAAGTPSDAPGAQSRFYEGVVQTLAALLEGPPAGVLWIDDAHWLDAATLDVLIYWARRQRERPYLLLLAWRDEDLALNAPLQAVVAELQQARRATLVSLARLTLEDVTAFVAAAQPTYAADLPARLYAETEGLPYFVVEYLAALPEEQPPMTDAAAWRMPRTVRELLHGRLARVVGVEQQLLQTAAAIGQAFSFELAQAASGRSEDEAVIALENLTRRGLLRESADFYEFSHEKLRTLAYEEMSLARRRLLHRRLAEALAAQAARSVQPASSAAQIGGHYRLAGQDAQAARYFAEAGEYARGLYAHSDALAYFELALALGHPQAAALQEACGDLHTRLGAYGSALDRYERAAAEAEGPELGRLEYKLGRVYQRLGAWPLAEQKVSEAWEQYGPTIAPATAAQLAADGSLIAQRLGQKETAVTRAQQALALAEQTADPAALAQAHNLIGILARDAGDSAAAVDHLQQSLALAEAAGNPDAQVAARNNLALALAAAGHTAPAQAGLQEALLLCRQTGDRHHEAALRSNLADLHHQAGEEEAAMEQLKQAAAILAEIGEEGGAWQPEIWKLTEW